MYKDIGFKIKALGIIVGWFLLIVGIIAGLAILSNTYTDRWGNSEYKTADDIYGYLALVGGALAFVSSWFVVGFGQLVEDTQELNSKYAPQKVDYALAEATIFQNGGWKCSCGRINARNVSSCTCGKSKSDI